MNRNLKELFRMLGKKTQTGSDYTGTVTKVKGKTAYVQFTGSDIADTPVSMSIDCKSGDHVRVRVNGGKAWITGNDTAPPSNDKEKVRAVQKNTDKLSKRIKAVEDGVEMKGIVHFKDLESDEETTINGGVINCNELKARDKLIVYGDVWEEQWDDEREDYISVDTGVDKEFEVVSFAQISPIFSLMYAFQGIDKVILATPTDDCPDPEIQTHHLTVSHVVSGGCSLVTPMELETAYTSQSYVTSANFNRLQFYQVGKSIICNVQLNLSASPGTTWRRIGSVNLPFIPNSEMNITIASQSNASTLLFQVTRSGVINIYSAGSASGWYRATAIMV